MHVAVAPARDAALAAHVLGEDAHRRDAADEVRGEVAVQHAQAVGRRHRPRRPGGDRLLPEAVVEGARDLALAVEEHRPLLDPRMRSMARSSAQRSSRRQVLRSEGRDVTGRLDVGRHQGITTLIGKG